MQDNPLQFKAKHGAAVRAGADKQNVFFPSVLMAAIMLESEFGHRAINNNLTRLAAGAGYKKKTTSEVTTLLILKEDSKPEEMVFIPNIEAGSAFGESAPAPISFRDYTDVASFVADFTEVVMEPLEKLEQNNLTGLPHLDLDGETEEAYEKALAELLKTQEGQLVIYAWNYYHLEEEQQTFQRVLKTLKSYWGDNNLVSLDTEFVQ